MAEELTLDVFKSDAFTMAALTDAVNKQPFVPGAVGRSGLFRSAGITQTTVIIEERAGVLTLIPYSTRGGPGSTTGANKRIARSFLVPHLERDSERILADEIQSVRAFGSGSALQTLQTVVGERMAQLMPMFDATTEYQRMGAVKGLILDADGETVLYNLFTEFNVVQQAFEINLNDDIRNGVVQLQRMSESELGAQLVQGYIAFCSDGFFDEFVAADEVRDTFKATTEAGVLRADLRKGFDFGGVTWVNYRGRVGNVDFIEDGAAYVCPVGTDIFTTKFAPADFLETANTVGLPRYAKMVLDEKLNRWAQVHMQSNPLSLCLRPRAVIKATLGT